MFDAGKDGQLSIPYRDITALTFDLDSHCPNHLPNQRRRRTRCGVRTRKEGARQILADLETRTGFTLEFGDVEACLRHKSPDECNYGTAAELRGLSTVYVDAADEDRELIVAELRTSQPRLQIVERRELRRLCSFRGERFNRPTTFRPYARGGDGRVSCVKDERPLSCCIQERGCGRLEQSRQPSSLKNSRGPIARRSADRGSCCYQELSVRVASIEAAGILR